MVLADLGADVIKVEVPEKGDDSRLFGPFRNGESGYFMTMNRNKRGITLDLRRPEGQAVLRDLAVWADVLLENFAAGTMDKWGLGYEHLAAINPRLIYASITGFGQYGPYAHRFAFDAAAGLRVDSGVEDGSEVTVHYDPMLAKVIARAESRTEAADRLAAALARARLHGPRTNRDLLVRILRHPEYRRGATDTHFLERHDPAALGAPLCDAAGERLHALAAAVALQAARRGSAPVLGSLPSGWRNVPSQDQEQAFESASGRLEVRYRFARDGLRARVGDEALAPLRLHAASAEEVDLELAGVRRRFALHAAGERVYVDSELGASALRALPRFAEPEAELAAGSLVAPMPGLVTQVCVAVGDVVAKGDVLIVLEAMKMEQPIRAPHGGRVAELRAAAGQQVEAGVVLAVIEEEAA
jgi:propionyl-CoA carboxylase alpha chain